MRVTKHEYNEASDELHGTLAASRMLILVALYASGGNLSVSEIQRRVESIKDKYQVSGRETPEFELGFRTEISKFLSNLHNNGDLFGATLKGL